MIKRGLALFALLFIIVVYFIYPLSYTAIEPDIQEQLSPYDDDYNDMSLFKEDLENIVSANEKGKKIDLEYEVYSIVASPTILNGPDVTPEETIYIAVGLEKKYTDDQISALIEFLRKGGKALFCDDYGYLSDFARYFGITYYRGKFFDNEFDRNENFTVVYPKLSVDQFTPYIPPEEEAEAEVTNTLMLNNLYLETPEYMEGKLLKWYDRDYPEADGIWDSDQDGDGRIDEDPPEKGTPIDDDMDKAKSSKDGLDNDHDGLIDEDDEEEGLNEDHLDDDGDWIDLNRNGIQEPMIWKDKNFNDKFDFEDTNGNNYFDTGDELYFEDEQKNKIWEYVSGDYGVDEEIYDGLDNDGDTLIDEDLKGYRILFNDATGMTSQGTRIIAHGGTSDPPSYVNLDDTPGADPPSIGQSPDKLVDEISSPGSEIQLIVEVVICPECGGAVDIRTGKCLDTISSFKVRDPCREHHNTKEFTDFGSAIFISDSSLFLNDIYDLDHLATDDDTNEIYHIDEDGDLKEIVFSGEWDNAPRNIDGPSDRDLDEARLEDETIRNYVLDQTPDGEPDYDNRVFAVTLIYHLLPKGGMIVFDESRHYQENEFLIPVYASIHVITFLTSDPWYSSAMIIIFILLLTFTISVVKNKENWIHRHNINLIIPRRSLPSDRSDQIKRMRWAILNKARMSRGLSPEEFQALSVQEVNNIIKDPLLIDIARNPNRTCTDEEMNSVMERISKLEK